ncbi:MAG: T9SS type A sorting domain-containing protein [Ignavibacteria bacterium]|nr:T9SS type A sorting domain-containing protein [Ignavibacteria bacterium]
MKTFSFLLLVVLISATGLFAQTWTTNYTKSETVQYEPDWAGDILVSSSEPFGKITGIAKANGTIYLAVSDTAIIPGKSIVIFKSINNGVTWTTPASYSGTVMPLRAKMVRTGLDSVYYFYLINSIIYCLNVESLQLGSITTMTYRDFDAVGSSTGGLYVVADALTSTSLPRYSSTNGFISTSQTGTVSNGAFPRMYMSGSGDTLILTFYGSTLTPDTISSIIRVGRYRESAPGTISSMGFQNVVTETQPKSEVQPVFYNGIVWMIYTLGTTGAIDIKYMLSTNSGLNYASPVILAGNPNTDEYWFEARHFIGGPGGVDIIYYSDSLQSGTPTNNSDKMLYSFAVTTAPTTFSSPEQFSEHIPGWSARLYLPALVEIYNTGDVGAAWVGLDGTDKKVYWDRYNAVTRIRSIENQIPQSYVLEQNYPNPFNPLTTIRFKNPKYSNIKLTVFDILGKEVSVLVNENLSPGSYEVEFNGEYYSSGVYFYRLQADNYIETKKMILMK